MNDKINDIFNFYKNICNENNRLQRQRVNTIEFLTTIKYLKELCPEESRILDACAGCGVYSFPLGELGHHVSSGDLVDHNVDQIRCKQNGNPVIEYIYTGSILDLSQFKEESFDVVLNLGSYYHLADQRERDRSIKESLRVLKRGGLYFLAYLNKYSNFIKYNQQWTSNFDLFEEYLTKGYTGDDSLFYTTSPEYIEQTMSNYNLKQLHNVATDGLKFVIRNSINELTDNEFERYMQLHFQMCEIKSLLGYSEHGLYIAEK